MLEKNDDDKNHLSGRRLREIALQHMSPTVSEMTHLDDCAECAKLVVIFSHQNGNQPHD